MVDSLYMSNRIKYARPQAAIWSDSYEISNGKYVPSGNEFEDFIILSDHNRSEISIGKERIENRKRMINGTMRSYHISDKLTFSLSWDMLPSRAFSKDPEFNSLGQITAQGISDYTADNGAGGVDIEAWYESHQGPFYMLLSYDKYNEFSSNKYDRLREYSQVSQVYFSSCEFSIVKRGGTNHDLWNVSVSLEEV